MVTRIAKIAGFDNLLGGRDLAGIFKEGHVYSVTEVMDVIMIKDLGEHAEQIKGAQFSSIMMNGTYLLTKEEHRIEKKTRREELDGVVPIANTEEK